MVRVSWPEHPRLYKKIKKKEEKTPSLTLLDLDELQEPDENGMKKINHLRLGVMIGKLPCKKPWLLGHQVNMH